jgi:predicted nucleotidyltransferase
MDFKSLRESKDLTQKEVAELMGLPFRTYQNYEYGKVKATTFTGKAIVDFLSHYERYSPDKGILPMAYLKEKVLGVVSAYSKKDVSYVILFGSYAKGKAGEKSDVDLLISGDLTGLAFYSLRGKLEVALKKNVDLLKSEDLMKNPQFLEEILSSGIRISD